MDLQYAYHDIVRRAMYQVWNLSENNALWARSAL